MEAEVITKIKVSDSGFPETVYEVCKIGAQLYLARPAEKTEESKSAKPEVYIEKSSEGWQHFTPSTPATLKEEVPVNILEQLIERIREYYEGHEKEDLPGSVAF